MHITDFLTEVAEELTDRPLPVFDHKEDFFEWRKKRQAKFHEMLGIDTYLQQPRTDLNVTITDTLQREDFRIDKLYYESLPGLYVAGNLYVPHKIDEKAPAILYVCGHNKLQKAHYQEHARRFAQFGFVVLVLDTIQLGENHGIHHGTHRHGWFHWISKGYTPTGVEVWNAIRGLDLLSELPEVDADRLGITGNSGGGAMTWWTACADDRIKVLAPSCGTGTIASHIREQTIDGHCDCMFPNNPFGWSLIEMCALAAPRPLLIVTPDGDRLFTIESVQLVYERLKDFYQKLGFGDHVSFMQFPGFHGYSVESRKSISQWFLRHLMGQKLSLEDVPDVDGFKEETSDLFVFYEGLLPNDESTSVQDWFIPLAEFPETPFTEELDKLRQIVKSKLRFESFTAFPDHILDPSPKIIQKSIDGQYNWFHKFTWLSERNWRLEGSIEGSAEVRDKTSPAAIYLRSPKDGKERADIGILNGLDESYVKAWLDVRGTGRTSWNPEALDWHVRRSLSLMGRSVASLRVWDTLQGIEAVKSLPQSDPENIMLAGTGEMAVVALYAALLDGNIRAVILENPPGSLDQPDNIHGKSPSMEIPNALRIADLPVIAALLWPTQLIFVGDRPDSYRYTEKIYRQLGKPGGTWRVPTLADWPGIHTL